MTQPQPAVTSATQPSEPANASIPAPDLTVDDIVEHPYQAPQPVKKDEAVVNLRDAGDGANQIDIDQDGVLKIN
jgi:hypothetical protein